jgi:hypothetical protein
MEQKPDRSWITLRVQNSKHRYMAWINPFGSVPGKRVIT